MFELSAHGADVHVGTGPQYPWGGLYGGQIVAQALRAAALSVEPTLEPHSIRAYFIRRGEHTEPIRFEVDRIRNGRSFATRRVVARQAIGAILNAERMKVNDDLGDPADPAAQLLHRCWLAYLSDDMPTESVVRAHPDGAALQEIEALFCASLDHTIWFHRPLRADRWHLYDFSCHSFIGSRGLSIGHIFEADGLHVATVAQEVLVRDVRAR
jgi:acyl-CoA thioesterase-2